MFNPIQVGRALGARRIIQRTPRRFLPASLAVWAAAFVLIALVPLASAEPLSPADLKALLARIRDKRAAAPQVQADFQEEKTVHMLNKPIISSGKMWFQSPNKFRREAKGNSPSITVSDGQHLWIYYPKFQSAEHYSLGKRSPLDAGIAAITASLNLENVEATYHITAAKEADGYQLELAPRNPSMKRLLQSFSIRMNNDLQVVRTEMLQPTGDRIITTYSNESRAPIPASTFEFTPPAGTDVTTPLGK
jgi:outer membrane lipoprotein carrier protein